MPKIDTTALENITSDIDAVSRALAFTCTSCAYCNTAQMLESAVDSIRIIQMALAQKVEALNEEIALIARCNE